MKSYSYESELILACVGGLWIIEKYVETSSVVMPWNLTIDTFLQLALIDK